MLGLLGASLEIVRARASRYGAHNRTRVTGALLDRETGPDLSWQWTLAVVVCAALAARTSRIYPAVSSRLSDRVVLIVS